MIHCHINDLFDDALLEILAAVPSRVLIGHGRQVCTKWRSLIDSSALWLLKCQKMGYINNGFIQNPMDWKMFFWKAKLRRNLLSNPRASRGFKSWIIDEDGGNHWKVEKMPGQDGQKFPDYKVRKYFVTSYRPCKKSQLIDLRKMGYRDHFIDLMQPDIVVKDWFAPRMVSGAKYELLVQLLSKHKKVLKEFHPKPVYMDSGNDGQWQQIKYTFRDYGHGVRYIFFQHGGHDQVLWAGWYGVRVTNSSVSLELDSL
ncbi:F-box only protein 6-like [Pelodytes ibericus]